MVSDRLTFVLWASGCPWASQDHKLLSQSGEGWLWSELPVATLTLEVLLEREQCGTECPPRARSQGGALVMYQSFLILALWPALRRNLALSPRPQIVRPKLELFRAQKGKDLSPARSVLTEKNFEGPVSWSRVPRA